MSKLEELREAVENVASMVEHPAHNNLTPFACNDIKVLLDLARLILEAQSEMPKEKACHCKEKGFLACQCHYDKYNQALHDCTIIHAKVVMEKDRKIEELAKIDAEFYNKTHAGLKPLMDAQSLRIEKLQSENSTLKENLEHRMNDIANYQETASKLEEENAKLKTSWKERKDRICEIYCDEIEKLHQQIEGLRADIKKVKNKDSEGGFGTELFV